VNEDIVTSDSLTRLAKLLDDYGVEYTLIGGSAVMAHALANNLPHRETEDFDMMINKTAENIDKLVEVLLLLVNLNREELTEGMVKTIDVKDEYGVVRVGDDESGIYYDIVYSMGEREYGSIPSVSVFIDEVEIKVADVATLIELKKSVTPEPRERDHIDIEILMTILHPRNKLANNGTKTMNLFKSLFGGK
jgi:hypothetical protein